MSIFRGEDVGASMICEKITQIFLKFLMSGVELPAKSILQNLIFPTKWFYGA